MTDTCCTCHRPAASTEPALAFELRVAEQALAIGDFAHARHHVAGAIALAPTEGRVLAAFEALATRTDLSVDPASNFFGDIAVTAFAAPSYG